MTEAQSMGKAGHDSSAAAIGQSGSPDQDGVVRAALILYGSETGNAQDVAEEISRMAERLRFETTVIDMDSVQLRDLVKPTLVIFAVSTAGQGEMPQNARRLWRALLSRALKPGLLRKLSFTSFGLGDSSYAQFNVAHRMLCARLLQLGAHAFCERGEGNEQHPEGHSAGFREWIVNLREKMLVAFPLPEGVEVLSDDVFVEPKWRLALVRPLDSKKLSPNGQSRVNGHTNGSPVRPLNGNSATTNWHWSDESPSTTLLPVECAYTAHILSNKRVTAPDHFQDVRLLDLQIDEPYAYGPGAVAVVYPKNFPQDVQAFINLMNWQDFADEPLALIPSTQARGCTAASPSPLRHFELSTTSLTIRWLLENVLDIMSIPRRTFFSSLAHLARTSTEDERFQRERLLELANPSLIDELWDYTTRPRRTILEVMADFTSLSIPFHYALTTLPIMRGRQFSIASGGALARDAQDRTKVELLVAIADPPSPIIKYRRRYGVCTRYIASLRAGQQLAIGLQQGYLDVGEAEMEVPVVLIGPGTGVAPMRAMIWQRLAWAQASGSRPAGKALKGDVLLFGCRAEQADYFFRDEWERLLREEGLTVLTAFSRQPGMPRQYVQDRIRIYGKEICEAVWVRKGKVYVCGSSGAMPKGVREALVDVLAECASMNADGAERYVQGMEKEGRYKQETW